MKCRIFRLSSSLEAFALPEPIARDHGEGVHTWWILVVVSPNFFPCKASGDPLVNIFEACKFWPVLHGHSSKFQSASPETVATMIHLAYLLSYQDHCVGGGLRDCTTYIYINIPVHNHIYTYLLK